jgi:serine-type D-Ala-D-Ala carboxypeptidase (penicillin-binding protein 5/6)
MSWRRASLTSGVEENDGRLGAVRVGIASLLVVCVFAAAVVVANEPWEEELSGSVVGPAVALQPVASPGSTAPVAAGPKGADAAKFALEPRPASLPVHVQFDKPPEAGVMFDVDSGEILWQRRPYRELPIASLTKMMTALLIAERHRPGEMVMITDEALAYEGSGVGVLPGGKKVRLEPMLNGLLLVSGNDAAIALAQHDAGNVDEFVKRMNTQAVRMGLTCTRFTSPHGLQDEGNYSCPIDLAELARADLANPRIREIAGSLHARFAFPIKGGFLDLYNNNPFIQNGTPGMTGLKTGYTEAAGRCYVMTRKVAGRHIGVVLLDSPHPLPQINELWEAAAQG